MDLAPATRSATDWLEIGKSIKRQQSDAIGRCRHQKHELRTNYKIICSQPQHCSIIGSFQRTSPFVFIHEISATRSCA
jgi:hypothetical protein